MRFFVAWTFFVIVLFSANAFAAQAVTMVSNMNFGDQVVGIGVSAVVNPNDAGAAVFDATGLTPGKAVTCTVTTAPINIVIAGGGATRTIAVNNFIISGCTSVVPASGSISGIRVGATATVKNTNLSGQYTASNANFRLNIK